VTAPLTPSDLDLRDFAYMPLDVVRLRDSDMMALTTAEGFRAAVSLWCASWHQVPAASIPEDDRVLCHLAGFGRDMATWQAVREEALRGFVLCSDGRLYHPVIAEKANEAKAAKDKQRNRTQAATDARKGRPNDEQRDVDRNDERNVDQEKGRELKGEEREPKIDENIIHLNSSAPPAAPERRKAAKPFPADGSIYHGHWGQIARQVRYGIDPDVIAGPFRDFCRNHDPPIPLDHELIEKRFIGFAKGHRINGKRAG
jgi:hypothetical protein